MHQLFEKVPRRKIISIFGDFGSYFFTAVINTRELENLNDTNYTTVKKVEDLPR